MLNGSLGSLRFDLIASLLQEARDFGIRVDKALIDSIL